MLLHPAGQCLLKSGRLGRLTDELFAFAAENFSGSQYIDNLGSLISSEVISIAGTLLMSLALPPKSASVASCA